MFYHCSMDSFGYSRVGCNFFSNFFSRSQNGVTVQLQGGNQLLTKSMAQLWPYFESWWLFEPTGGSPDVVHLLIDFLEEGKGFNLNKLWHKFSGCEPPVSGVWPKKWSIECQMSKNSPNMQFWHILSCFEAMIWLDPTWSGLKIHPTIYLQWFWGEI